MALVDYLDKGASLGPGHPCLVAGDRTLSYDDVVQLSVRVAVALARSGIDPGQKVAILSANDPIAFATVFGISRAGAVWCPINPRSEAEENRALLDLFDCRALIFQSAFAPLVEAIAPLLPDLVVYVCLDGESPLGPSFDDWIAVQIRLVASRCRTATAAVDDTVMLVGTGGTTGAPKGVELTDRNLETMTAITLMSYPFRGRPTYLALAPLTHAAGVLCFPILALGGRVVIMAHADVGEFLHLIEHERVTHTFLPPTVIYLAAGPPAARRPPTTARCSASGTAPRRCRRPAWRRRSTRSARSWASCSARPRRR